MMSRRRSYSCEDPCLEYGPQMRSSLPAQCASSLLAQLREATTRSPSRASLFPQDTGFARQISEPVSLQAGPWSRQTSGKSEVGERISESSPRRVAPSQEPRGSTPGYRSPGHGQNASRCTPQRLDSTRPGSTRRLTAPPDVTSPRTAQKKVPVASSAAGSKSLVADNEKRRLGRTTSLLQQPVLGAPVQVTRVAFGSSAGTSSPSRSPRSQAEKTAQLNNRARAASAKRRSSRLTHQIEEGELWCGAESFPDVAPLTASTAKALSRTCQRTVPPAHPKFFGESKNIPEARCGSSLISEASTSCASASTPRLDTPPFSSPPSLSSSFDQVSQGSQQLRKERLVPSLALPKDSTAMKSTSTSNRLEDQDAGSMEKLREKELLRTEKTLRLTAAEEELADKSRIIEDLEARVRQLEAEEWTLYEDQPLQAIPWGRSTTL